VAVSQAGHALVTGAGAVNANGIDDTVVRAVGQARAAVAGVSVDIGADAGARVGGGRHAPRHAEIARRSQRTERRVGEARVAASAGFGSSEIRFATHRDGRRTVSVI